MVFKRCSIGTNWYQNVPIKYPPHHYTTTTSLNRWDKAGWIHAFMFFLQILTLHLNVAAEIETHQTRQRFSNLLLSNFCEPVQIVAKLFPVLSWQERHPVWSSTAVAHLLQGSTCCTFRDGILHTLIVMSGYLSYCCLSIISNQSAHSPLTSTRHFRPHNCRSQDIFSFSDNSL